ncbi:hypothetical protein K1719_036291 [Acacia pycnantha]|nr:hypothetical protein K1719_036291 [Acacia pycnantha]
MEKGLWCWCSVLWLSLRLTKGVLSSEHANKSCTSSCGIITNISYPFRLRDDPPYCGHHRHELACEDNITLLHLHDSSSNDYARDGRYRVVGRDEVLGTYRVVGINYNNYTIRLVDAGIQKGNCSSLPCYSLSPSNFISSKYYQDSSNLYDTETLSNNRTDYIDLVKQVGYLNCSNPVRDDTAYVDTAPCVNWESKGGGHLYAVVGDLLAHQFKPQCRLKLVTLTAQDWKSLVPGGIKSYTDIHTLLSSGFELSWLPRLCADRNCPNHTYCDFTPESQSPQCVPQERCVSPLGIHHSSCGKYLIHISIRLLDPILSKAANAAHICRRFCPWNYKRTTPDSEHVCRRQNTLRFWTIKASDQIRKSHWKICFPIYRNEIFAWCYLLVYIVDLYMAKKTLINI